MAKLDLSSNCIGENEAKHLADALATNKVHSFFIYLLSRSCLSQKLQTLDVGANNIGDEGTEYLVKLLNNRSVNNVIDFFVVNVRSFCVQTILMLDLRSNLIIDEGVRLLTNALRNNRVILNRHFLGLFVFHRL